MNRHVSHRRSSCRLLALFALLPQLEGAGQPATFDPNHQAFVDQLRQSLLHMAAVPQEVAAVRRSDVREDGVNGDASTRVHLLYPGEEHHAHRCTKHRRRVTKRQVHVQ